MKRSRPPVVSLAFRLLAGAVVAEIKAGSGFRFFSGRPLLVACPALLWSAGQLWRRRSR